MDLIKPPSGLTDLLISVLRTSIRQKAATGMRTTPQSRVYRRRAALTAQLAEAEQDPERMLPLVLQVQAWIQIAENEEALEMAQWTSETPPQGER